MLEIEKPVNWDYPLSRHFNKKIVVNDPTLTIKIPKQIDVMVEVYGPNGLTMMVSHRKLRNAKELGLSLRG